MNKWVSIIAVVGALAFSISVITLPSDPIPLPPPPNTTKNASVTVIAQNLENPRALATHGDRIFVTEKGGALRVVQDDTLLESPLATFRSVDTFDGGLIGVAVHPNFDENHYLYVFVTYERGDQLYNKIVQITESNNRLESTKTILDDIPSSQFTNGGFIKFGPDNKLYIGTGATSDASHLPQDINSLSGKILRINDDGTIPDDNPWPNSPVYSIGHRNPQGMTWDDNGRLFVAEFGPEKNDEINLILPGKNYGWPELECTGNERFEAAVLCYDPSIEPGGILYYAGDRLDIDSPFIMASLRSSNLYQLDFEEGLASQKAMLGGVGRIRDVVVSADQSIYVITSNTDGKGFPDPMDDKLLRVSR